MTARRPIVRINGKPRQLPAGDVIDGASPVADIPSAYGISSNEYVPPAILKYALRRRERNLGYWLGGVEDGSVDKRAAYVQALADTRMSNTLLIDCPVKLSVLSDPSKPIFHLDGHSVRMVEGGEIIIDQGYVPSMVLGHARGCEFKGLRVRYIGGAFNAADNTYAAETAKLWVWNQYKAWLIANRGMTFPGGTVPQRVQNSDYCSWLRIEGDSDPVFEDCQVYVPDGVGAELFLPVGVGAYPQFPRNSAVTTSTTFVDGNVSYPNIQLDDLVMDGYWMGFTGTAKIALERPKWRRYADCQSAGGTNVGGIPNSDGSASFPPPHAFYVHQIYPVTARNIVIRNAHDEGVSVGAISTDPLRVNLSLKLGGIGHVVDGYICDRLEGFCDFRTCWDTTIRNVVATYDSSLYPQGKLPPFRFPGDALGTPYLRNRLENITMRDLAAQPACVPFSTMSTDTGHGQMIPNSGNVMTGIHIFMETLAADSNGGHSYGFTIEGQGNRVEATYHYTDTNPDTNTFRAVIPGAPSTPVDSDFDITLIGWPAYTLGQAQFEPRITVGNSRARIRDLTNGWSGEYRERRCTKRIDMSTSFTPAAGVGAQNVGGGLVCPAKWSPLGAVVVSTTFGAPITALKYGFAGDDSLVALGSATFNNSLSNAGGITPLPATTSDRPAQITPVGATTFNGTGAIVVSLSAEIAVLGS